MTSSTDIDRGTFWDSLQLPQSHGRQRWCFVSEDKLGGFSEIRKLRLEFTEVLVRSCEGSNVLTSCVYGLLRARRSGKVIELWRCWTAVIQICGASSSVEVEERRGWPTTIRVYISWRDSGLHYDSIVRGFDGNHNTTTLPKSKESSAFNSRRLFSRRTIFAVCLSSWDLDVEFTRGNIPEASAEREV